jgi:hypothetical protein
MEFVYAADRTLDQIANLLSVSFEGYIVSIPFSVPLLLSLMRTEGIDLQASRIVRISGADAGIALVSRRGDESRVAAFGIGIEHRRRGIGNALVDQLVSDARGRGDRRMVLECIEQNPAAVRLYEGKGFRRQRRLLGFTSPGVTPVANPELTEISIRDVCSDILDQCDQDLPWQISPASLLQAARPTLAYLLGPSKAVLTPGVTGMQLRVVVTEVGYRRQGYGRALLRAIAAKYPGLAWNVSPLWPEEIVGSFLQPLGFVTTEISQWQMELPLNP